MKTIISLGSLCLLMLMVFSCNPSKQQNETAAKNQAVFDKNIATFNEMLKGFAEEDSNKFMAVFADSLKWSGPDKIKLDDYESKEVLKVALDGYMQAYDNHELKDKLFFAGSVYSSRQTSDDPNAIRVFGNWHHTHTESGVDVMHKWVGIVWFNEDGEIYQFNDFFDVGGFALQHLQ